jgi:hypothetical protein
LNFDQRVEQKLRKTHFGEEGNTRYNEYDDTPVVERTITVACFPHETVGLTASLQHDQISPAPDYDNPVGQMTELFRYATQPSSRKELYVLYEKGWADAEKWSYEEDLRDKELMECLLQEQRQNDENGTMGGNLF